MTIAIAIIKAGLFFSYYAYFFDGTYTFLDDWSYFHYGQSVYQEGLTWSLLFSDQDSSLRAIAGGSHYLYYLYNAGSFALFGEHYCAPVACNILLTIGIAWWGSALAAREFGWTGIRQHAFFALLALHPDILAWSTVMNGKDILVLLLHVGALDAIARSYRRFDVWSVGGMVLMTMIFSVLRFYVPIMLVLAWAISTMLNRHDSHRAVAALIIAALLTSIWVGIDLNSITGAYDLILANLENPLFGLAHFIFTPIPFGTDPEYAFLNVPALLHWLSIPCIFCGIWALGQVRGGFGRYFKAYLLVFSVLYAVYSELQGPRHRVQLDFALACLQFAGFRWLFMNIRGQSFSLLDDDSALPKDPAQIGGEFSTGVRPIGVSTEMVPAMDQHTGADITVANDHADHPIPFG